MNSEIRQFDLNIERVLEHWAVAHAIREIIANALDEQALTSTADPVVFKDDEGLGTSKIVDAACAMII